MIRTRVLPLMLLPGLLLAGCRSAAPAATPTPSPVPSVTSSASDIDADDAAEQVEALAQPLWAALLESYDAAQASYTEDPTTFTELRTGAVTLEEVYPADGAADLLFRAPIRLKAADPDKLVLFDDTVEDGWMVPPEARFPVVVLQRAEDGGLTFAGGYETEASAGSQLYQSDFQRWLEQGQGVQL